MIPTVTVEIEGGCCTNVVLQDADGHAMAFELNLIDWDNINDSDGEEESP